MSKSSRDDASARAASAAQRVLEVEERLKTLRTGRPSTVEDVGRAELALTQERERSGGAYRRAAQAHLDSASSHRQAADLLEAAGRLAQAAEHRRMAFLDDEGARGDSEAARLDPEG